MSQLAKRLIAENKRTQAKSLDLGNCGLTDLEKEVPELFDCVWLEELNLGDYYYDSVKKQRVKSPNGELMNKIGDKISIITQLPNLTSIHVDDNKITNADFLENFKKLKILTLSYSKISDIQFLEKLTSLHTLDLSENQISNIQFLEKLTSLHTLDLSGNQISDYQFLEKLTSLHTLDLSGNQISDLQFLEKLTSLHTLYLSDNQISDITPLLFLIKKGLRIDIDETPYNENVIHLYNNPITTPPIEIVREGNQAILNYFEELELQGSEVVYEAKLLILGEAGAGKTSLQRKIGNCEADLPDEILDTTTGISITQHPFVAREDLPRFTMHIWDFGGQEVYHATHQFFLSKRSLYVLVDDGRKEDRNDYWLQVQELFAQDSPVLILQNKKGAIHRSIPLNDLKSEFANIRELAVINLKEETEKIPAFCRTLEHYIRNLPQFQKGETLPKKWVRIREALEETDENYITLRDFRKICRKEGIPEVKRQNFLSDYLHDLGVMLHFQDSELLKKMVILRPEWATNAVYAILNHTKKQGKDGQFTYADLEQVWREEDYQDVFEELLALMQKFELCYQLKRTKDRYIVPQLLSDEKPKYDWSNENNLQLRYEYDFMPKGIVTRFIVRLHQYIENQRLVWKRGTVLQYKNTRAQIIEEYRSKAINIRITGLLPQDLISIVAKNLDEINGSFHFNERMKVRKMVPCICPTCGKSNAPELHDYDRLIASFKMGRPKFFCNTGYDFFHILDALYNIGDSGKNIGGSVFSPKRRTSLPSNKHASSTSKKVFIAYAEQDKSYLEALEAQLAVLERNNKITTWNKSHVLPSEIRDERIREALEEADIVLLLLSADFLASDYMYDLEVQAAIVPIVVHPCLWEASGFEPYQALPLEGKPISEWSNSHKAWLEVVKGIQKLL